MNDRLDEYARWRAADESGRDEEADRAFKTVFSALVPQPLVSSEFTSRTMAAIAAAAARDARRARRTRAALISGAIVGGSIAAYYGTGAAVSFLASLFIGSLNLLVAAIVRGAAGAEAGASLWGLLTSLGRAAGAFAANPKVTVGLFAIPVIAMAALVALQRLLGSDGELFE